MQSSQDLLEPGRTPAAAPRPWQGEDSPKGGGAEEGAGGSVEVRMEPYPWRVLGILCSSMRGFVC